jgi:hypothetical protein
VLQHKEKLNSALEGSSNHKEKVEVLKSAIDSHAMKSASELSFSDFYKVVCHLPRVRGERVQWVRSLSLDAELAKLLANSKCDIFAVLKGLKEISEADLKAYSEAACVRSRNFLPDIQRPLQAQGKAVSALQQHINTKLSIDGAFVGRFAMLADF